MPTTEPTTDDRLRAAGAEWRRHVDAAETVVEAPVRTAPPRKPARPRHVVRRRLLAAAIPVAAASVIVGGIVLVGGGGGGFGGSSASCAAPQLVVGPPERAAHERPAETTVLRRGRTLTVSGNYYLTDCYDTGRHGDPPAYGRVRLSLASAGGTGDSVRLATVHPDHDGAFTTTIRVPDDFPTGPATLQTDVGVSKELDVVVTSGASSSQSSSSTNR